MCRTKSVMQCTLHECPTHRGTRRVSQPKQGPCCSLYFRNVCRYPQSGAGHCLEIWHRLGSISAMPRFPSNAQIGVPDPSLLGMSSVSERTYRACSGSPAWTKSPPPAIHVASPQPRKYLGQSSHQGLASGFRQPAYHQVGPCQTQARKTHPCFDFVRDAIGPD